MQRPLISRDEAISTFSGALSFGVRLLPSDRGSKGSRSAGRLKTWLYQAGSKKASWIKQTTGSLSVFESEIKEHGSLGQDWKTRLLMFQPTSTQLSSGAKASQLSSASQLTEARGPNIAERHAAPPVWRAGRRSSVGSDAASPMRLSPGLVGGRKDWHGEAIDGLRGSMAEIENLDSG